MLKNVLICFITTCSSFNSFSQDEWVLKKNTNNIQIYTRHLEHIPFDEYKAVTSVNASIKNVLKELLEVPKYYENCPSGISYYLKSMGNNQHIFYAKKSFPWPIKDRDIITLLTVENISDKKIKRSLESLPNEILKKEKTVRIKTLIGHWLLEVEEEKKTKVTQQLVIDPEGSLPPFMVNALLIKGPYKTFSQWHEIKEKPS